MTEFLKLQYDEKSDRFFVIDENTGTVYANNIVSFTVAVKIFNLIRYEQSLMESFTENGATPDNLAIADVRESCRQPHRIEVNIDDWTYKTVVPFDYTWPTE